MQLFAAFRVQSCKDVLVWEETVRIMSMFHNKNRRFWAVSTLAGLILMAMSAFAQQGAMSPNQDEKDGVSAGGNWMEFQSEDKMTGAKQVRFELLANNYLKGDPDYKPRVELSCTNGKYKFADFNPGAALGKGRYPGYPGYGFAPYPYPYAYGPYPYGWYAPKAWVMVRIDGSHDHKGWNLMRGNILSMDKGTVRGMIGAQVFNVEVRTKSGFEIAEFSPEGLNLDEVKHSCDLTHHKP